QAHRLDPVGRLADHQQILLGGDQLLEALAHLGRVVDDQDRDRPAAHRLTSSVMLRCRGAGSPSSTAGRRARRTLRNSSMLISFTACSGRTASVTWVYSTGAPACPAGTSV